MEENPHKLKHLKYISLINVRVIRLIYENKLERAKHLNDFKETLKKYPLLKPLKP
jgi:hypothetical protein